MTEDYLRPLPDETASYPSKKEQVPIPINFQVTGKRVLVWQYPSEERYGILYLPQDAAEHHKATVGEIVQIGDGFIEHEPLEAQQDWIDRMPFSEGDVVVWGRYQDKKLKLKVHPDDLTEEEREEEARLGRAILKEFVILEVSAIWGKAFE